MPRESAPASDQHTTGAGLHSPVECLRPLRNDFGDVDQAFRGPQRERQGGIALRRRDLRNVSSLAESAAPRARLLLPGGPVCRARSALAGRNPHRLGTDPAPWVTVHADQRRPQLRSGAVSRPPPAMTCAIASRRRILGRGQATSDTAPIRDPRSKYRTPAAPGTRNSPGDASLHHMPGHHCINGVIWYSCAQPSPWTRTPNGSSVNS